MSKTHQKHKSEGYVSDQREFFDELVTVDWNTYASSHWDQVRKREVAEILRNVPSHGRILDVGCGSGFHDLIFAQSEDVDEVIGVDYSPKSIERANAEYPHPKIKRFVADILDDGSPIYGMEPFDIVTSFQVIEHLEDPGDFLRRCAQLAKSGGAIAVITPNRHRLENRVRALLGMGPRRVDPLHFQEFTIAELQALGASHGLVPTASFGYALSFGTRRHIFLHEDGFLSETFGWRIKNWANGIGVIFTKGAV